MLSLTGTSITPDQGVVVQLGGLGVVSKITAAMNGGSFTVVEHPLEPHALAGPVHTHTNEDEYSYVLEGTVGARIGDTELVAGPGTWILKPHGVPHTFWNAGGEPARLIEIISPGGFESYFGEMADLIASWGSGAPDFPSLLALGDRYGLSYDLASVPDLVQRHGLCFGG
jgi:mannose-6-phosphate isomerase-like protein (cupin superfamily)